MQHDMTIRLTETDDAYLDDDARLVFRSSRGTVTIDLADADPFMVLALVDDLAGRCDA